MTGQTGLIAMPDARLAPEGTWRTGYSRLDPYRAIWSSLTVLPWIEGSFRFTEVDGVPGFPDPAQAATYGDFKDKSFDLKVLALPERGPWPALALGMQDIAGGTGVFRAPYAVASKRLGTLDFTLGYGGDRIDGAFGGARWSPRALPGLALVLEYDAYDYSRDPGPTPYRKGVAAGVEYRHGWVGAKAFAAHDQLGFNVYLSVPLEQREFVPKVDEPAPYAKVLPRPTEAQWDADPEHRQRLGRALVAQDFREVALGYRSGRLEAALTNVRISSMPRAVGRAARTMLAFAPLETREVKVTYLQGTLPVATYTFTDAALLQRYFNGMASREQLEPTVAVAYARPEDARIDDGREALEAFAEPLPESIVVGRIGADLIAARGENLLGGVFQVRPALSTYLNDPAGAFKFDVSLIPSWHRALGRNTFLQLDTKLTLYENVSDVTQPSNSTLPHVRSDVAQYKSGNDFKLLRLLGNHYLHPAERVYARVSAGIYEEMYSGAGGQVAYLSRGGGWSADLAVDWLRQRDFEGGFGHLDYRTVTAIASLNYRMAHGVTGTLRGGRFLAKDEGVRAEVKRRFASGFEAGVWYTVTNGDDITSPGSPSSPYYDKGIFMVMPLDTLLTYDTQAAAGFSLAPWTRDVGQMVISPGDLAGILERPVLQMHGERPKLGAERRWFDWSSREVDWLRSGVVAAGSTLGAAAFDDAAFEAAERNRNKEWMKGLVRVGDALPLAAIGLSAVFAFDESRPRLSGAGTAALEAGGVAFVAATGLKYGVGRARPTAGLGNHEFEPFSSDDRFHSFPSRHTTVMWAAVTPYAKEFGMPWLYGVAALTNLARTGSREHWFSDTVAGSFIGYALGSLAWEGRRRKGVPSVSVSPGGVTLGWELQ